MSEAPPTRRVYEPPVVHTVGAVESLTLGGDHNYNSDSLQKRWGRHGDFWHWYRPHHTVRSSAFS